MILGAFEIKMRTIAHASLPISHGRLLHAAVLDLVRKYDEELSQELHDANIKSFSLGLLDLGHLKPSHGKFNLMTDTRVNWELCSLDTRLTKLLMGVADNTVVRIGSAVFEIEHILLKNNLLVDTDQLVAKAEALKLVDSFTIKFVTPTTFRFYNVDYPFPRPDLIFGSLAERWNRIDDTLSFDIEKLKAIANQYIVPIRWDGASKRVNTTPKIGVTGFTGVFTFDMKVLPEAYRKIFVLLLLFSAFSGIGRLTAQGLGKAQIEYNN